MSAQLELFQPLVDDVAVSTPGIPEHVARASISPGWWRLVSPLYTSSSESVSVEVCHELDGCLHLEATITGPDGTTSLDLAEVRAAAAHICGCCSAAGRPYRARLDGPTRVVCDRCKARLQGGESYLTIADDYFHIDGSYRLLKRGSGTFGRAIASSTSPPARRACAALPPDELRQLIGKMRVAMNAEIVGQPDAVARLAMLAAVHVGGGLPRGGRALLLGPTGVGKSSLIRAMSGVLAGWDVPVVTCSVLDLTSPGWSGAPSIGDLVEASLKGASPDSLHSRRAVVVLDELHHARVIRGTDGNMAAKRNEVLASLLDIAGHGTLHFEGGEQWSSEQALVIGVGAFSGLLDLSRPPSVREIVAAGIPLELATRLAEEILVLHHLPEAELIQLFRRWPALTSLQSLCERLGFGVRILDESYRHAARIVTLSPGASSPRTGGGWLVSALRLELVRALQETGTRDLVITPDSLPIPPNALELDSPEDREDGPPDWPGSPSIGRWI